MYCGLCEIETLFLNTGKEKGKTLPVTGREGT
jgi:hypothetical protein